MANPIRPQVLGLRALGVLVLAFWGWLPEATAGAQQQIHRTLRKPVTWQSIGPGGGGALTDLEVDPFDANTIFATSDVGGFYKSVDHGASWSISNAGLIHNQIDDLLVSPFDSQLLYVATFAGVYRSLDGGASWVLKRSGFPPLQPGQLTMPVSCLTMHPNNPNILWAGTGLVRFYASGWLGPGKIYRSTDGGENWVEWNAAGQFDPGAVFFSIVCDPMQPSRMYAATNLGVYRSSDGGVTWVKKVIGLPHQHARQILVHPSTPNVLWVSLWLDDAGGGAPSGVYKSTDSGDTWVASSLGLPQGTEDVYGRLVMEPGNPSRLYVGNMGGIYAVTRGVYQSTDGGATWVRSSLNGVNVNQGWIDFWGFDVLSLAVAPSAPNEVYFGTGGLLIRSENRGTTWDQIYSDEVSPGRWRGRGLEATYVTDVAVDFNNPSRIYAGYMDLRLLRSEDGGRSWVKLPLGNGSEGNDVFTVTVDPGDSNVVYMTDGEVAVEGNIGNLWRSLDKGNSWGLLSTKNPYAGLPYGKYKTFVIDPSSPLNARTLYTACIRTASESQIGGIFKSTDGGVSWSAANTGLPSLYRHVVTMAIDPFDPQHLWAGVPVWFQYGTGGLFESHNGGASWSATAAGTLRSVWKVLPDPINPGIVWAATSSEFAGGMLGGVYKSTDGGVSFTRASAGMPAGTTLWVTDLAIDPADPDTLIATTGGIGGDIPANHGAWVTLDGGQSWKSAHIESSILDTFSISADPVVPGRFFLGTAGNGLFKGRVR